LAGNPSYRQHGNRALVGIQKIDSMENTLCLETQKIYSMETAVWLESQITE
jgi:hypothetical protein